MSERSNAANFLQLPLSEQTGGTSTTFTFESTAKFPDAPFYGVAALLDDAKREVVKVVSKTATTLECSTLDNRYLAGSVAESGITHDPDTPFLVSPLAQNLDDIWDAIEALVQALDELDAADVSFDPSGTDLESTDVEAAIKEVAAGSGSTVVNTDGDPGKTIYVGSVDPADNFTPVAGDVWIEVPS